MGFHLLAIRRASLAASKTAAKYAKVPKGYLAVYVGDKIKRFVIPVSYLSHPSFQELLSQSGEEYGYNHPMGGLYIPCTEHVFQHITSQFA